MFFIPIYILILFVTILIDYFAGRLIENAKGHNRKVYLTLSIVTNVGILVFYKYFNFFAENINLLFDHFNSGTRIPILDFVLPIGLSFHTFQAMSYTIEVYRGNQKAEHHIGIYALYVMFYPQLVAGPIERPQNVLHQFWEKHEFSHQNVAIGLRLMLWGMIKKVVIADRLAIVTNSVFNNVHGQSAIVLAIAAVFFTVQIFCDFSGYSSIALGTAQVMGFRLMRNFNHPFSATSIAEFWKKWHISLSTWFRDYVYIPLGGNRVNKGRQAFNLFFVFLLSGFWHGASWNFIIWGVLHGLALTFENLTSSFRKALSSKIPSNLFKITARAITFSYVCFAFIFFRANTFNDAVYFIQHLVKIPQELPDVFKKHGISRLHMPFSFDQFNQCLAAIGLLELIYYIQLRFKLDDTFSDRSVFFRYSAYTIGLFVLIFFGEFSSNQFIYFQF